MRTIVDLPPAYLEALDAWRRGEGISRAEAVRRAIAEHLQRHHADTSRAFGLWRERRLDSVEHQRRLRREWDRAHGTSKR